MNIEKLFKTQEKKLFQEKIVRDRSAKEKLIQKYETIIKDRIHELLRVNTERFERMRQIVNSISDTKRQDELSQLRKELKVLTSEVRNSIRYKFEESEHIALRILPCPWGWENEITQEWIDYWRGGVQLYFPNCPDFLEKSEAFHARDPRQDNVALSGDWKWKEVNIDITNTVIEKVGWIENFGIDFKPIL